MGDGVHITGQIGGLGAGQTHAIHVHEKGDCSAADASSAGGHFNPTGSPHGRASTPTHHAGDMDNLTANAQGVADVNIHLAGVTLGGGAATDIAGRAAIVHAAPAIGLAACWERVGQYGSISVVAVTIKKQL